MKATLIGNELSRPFYSERLSKEQGIDPANKGKII
jgi:hypothetical protein